MSIASGSRHGLRYIAEVTPGTTPDTPQMKSLRHTGCTLSISRDSITSNELRFDRQISAVRTMADKIQGAVNVEYSFGEYDDLLASAFCAEWDKDTLKAGIAEKPLSMERAFTDIGQYGLFAGCYINRMSMSLKPNALVTGNFDIIGLSAAYADTPACAAPTASQNHFPFDSFTGAITEGNTPIGIVTGLDFSLENGINPQFVLMRRSASFVTMGKSTCTGTLSAFFDSPVMLQKFLSETPSSINLTLGNGTAASYEISFPHVIYTGADNPASDDGPITLSMPFSAILDTTLQSNIKITRIK